MKFLSEKLQSLCGAKKLLRSVLLVDDMDGTWGFIYVTFLFSPIWRRIATLALPRHVKLFNGYFRGGLP
jgi:hypothetical protein